MVSELIYKADAHKAILKENPSIAYCIDNIKPVDAVEVVRCKDCEYFTEGMAVGMCKRVPDKPIIPVVYDHFCSYGERRNDV